MEFLFAACLFRAALPLYAATEFADIQRHDIDQVLGQPTVAPSTWEHPVERLVRVARMCRVYGGESPREL